MKPPTIIPPADPGSILNRRRRKIERDVLADGATVDLLVIGGGVTGTGVALDAASRGLSVALVERDDLASGTSSSSSKLVHGGLRYLAKGDVAVAWESAAERSLVASRIAPHLTHPIGQLVPIYGGDQTMGYLSGVGFVAGDLLRRATGTPRGLLKSTRRISTQRALELAPSLRQEGLRGAMLGWDCQLEDDARLVVAIARTAAAYGAKILTRTEAVSVNSTGAIVRDTEDGTTYDIKATNVVNAAGVWAGSLDEQVTLSPSVGTHLVVRSSVLGNSNSTVTVAVPGSFGRYLFSLPQPDGLTYIGLTDNDLHGDVPHSISPPAEDIAWLLDTFSSALEVPLRLEDVVGSFAGMRPLVTDSGDPNDADSTNDTAKKDSADISRHHFVRKTDNLVTITGGKLTTYRRMASDAVDLLTERKCRTKDISLVGAGPHPEVSDVPDRLWRRYGTEAPMVWDFGNQDPSLRGPVAPGIPTLGVEFAFGADYELGLSPEDLLDRRTRIGLVPDDAAAAAPVAEKVLQTINP